MKSILLALVFSLVLTACGDTNTSETSEVIENSEVENQEISNEETEKGDFSSEASENTDKDEKILKVGVTAAYKPWCYEDEDGNIVGVDVDVLKEAAKRMGDYEIEFLVSDFEGIFGNLDSGKVNTVAEQITVTEKRLEKYNFSSIFAYNPYQLLVQGNENNITSFEDLYGKTFAASPQSSSLDFMEKWKSENDPNDEIKILTSDVNYLMVESNQADATTVAVPWANQYIEESGADMKLVGDVVFTEENAYPFRKDEDPNLVEKFSEAIDSMMEDGFLSDLYIEYFGIDLSHQEPKL